jgi:hypothetical protein
VHPDRIDPPPQIGVERNRLLIATGMLRQKVRNLAGQIFEDSTAWAGVAVAFFCEVTQRISHSQKLGDPRIQLCDMRERHLFDVGARATILPKAQKPLDIFDRKAEFPRAFDKAQNMQVRLSVDSIAALAALSGSDQADTFIVADHLRVNAARGSSFADIHRISRSPPLDLPIMGSPMFSGKSRFTYGGGKL